MKFHFLLQRNQGWYHFDSKDILVATTKKSVHKQIVVQGEELHNHFLRILDPVFDYFKDNDIKRKGKYLTNDEVYFYLNKDEQLKDDCKTAILEFANKYGLGTSECFINLEYELYGIGDQPLEFRQYSVFNLIEVALKMAELLVARTSYETVPRELKEICNRYGHNLKPQLNGGLYYEVSDIFASMFWTMAFTEYQHKVKECIWCGSPILGDIRASFCRPPRQCKNKFNNLRRPTKKERKK